MNNPIILAVKMFLPYAGYDFKLKCYSVTKHTRDKALQKILKM